MAGRNGFARDRSRTAAGNGPRWLSLGLAEARKQAARWRAVAAANRDPIKNEAEARPRGADIALMVITAALNPRRNQRRWNGGPVAVTP